jgi:hypothetical protein
VVGAAAGVWSLDRGDRARGRPRPLHRLLLGAQARPDVLPCGTPRGARPHRARAAGRDRLLRALDPRHGRRVPAQPDDDPPLACQHKITTGASSRRSAGTVASAAGTVTPDLPCPAHGMTRHVPRADGSFRCARCRSEQVAARRRRVKRQLVDEAGGCCELCGYDACLGALQFHHVDPGAKSFAISRRGVTRALSKAREEAAKCVLLCANCHAEVEAGLAQLPLRSDDHGHVVAVLPIHHFPG